MERNKHQPYTFNDCMKIAQKFNYRTDFSKSNNAAYNLARRNGWLDEICSHMKIKGNKILRCIYVYEFIEYKVAYIGLTSNISRRNFDHRSGKDKSSQVYKFAKENNINIPDVLILTNYVPIYKAKILEVEWFEKYKKDGWNMLNLCKCGGLGGNNKVPRLTKDEYIKLAQKFSKTSDFLKKYKTYYRDIFKNNWQGEVFKHIYANPTKEYKSKPIVMLSVGDKYLKEFESLSQAILFIKNKKTSTKLISDTCDGKRESAYGYKWIYKKDYNI